MKSYVLDSNIILRYLLNDVPKQARETEELFRLVQKKDAEVTITPVIIVETAFVLLKLYKKSKHEIVKQLIAFVDNPMFEVSERSILHNALAFWDVQNISLVDCYAYTYGQHSGKEVFTFDKKLAKMAKVV